ncbi:hypothetical protein [Acinetobacter sp. ANC 4648]|nr:hypothetical protein [Acinetobacter sp. ANC 4648]
MHKAQKIGMLALIVLFILFLNYYDKKLADISGNKSNHIQDNSILLND